MRTKLCAVILTTFAVLMLSSPAFAQKKGGKQNSNRGRDHKIDRGHDKNRNRNSDGDRRDNKAVIKINRHPHHWGRDHQSGWYAGTNGFGYFSRSYTSCHNYYYPRHPAWVPGVCRPWERQWYFYSANPCPIHNFIHDGYCEYYFDDNGGCEVFYFAP